MKLAVVLLLTAIAAQAVVAEPGIFGDLISSIKNATNNAIDKAIEKAKNLYRSALDQFASLTDKMKDLERRFKESGEEWLSSSFDMAKKFVTTAEIQIHAILKTIDENLEVVTKEIVQILLKETSDLQSWANSTLDTLGDPVKRAKGEVIMRKFVDRSLEKMNNCANEATKPIQELYQYANATGAEAADLVRKIVDLLETCSKGCEKTILLAQLPGILMEGYDLMALKIAPMKFRVAFIGAKGAFKFTACVTTVKKSTNNEKLSVEKKVKALA